MTGDRQQPNAPVQMKLPEDLPELMLREEPSQRPIRHYHHLAHAFFGGSICPELSISHEVLFKSVAVAVECILLETTVSRKL